MILLYRWFISQIEMIHDFESYPDGFLLGSFFLFSFLLQLVIRHGDDGEDQIDEIK